MNAEDTERYAIRKDFRYLHEPMADELSETWVVGRSARAQELADRIMLSRGGAFLVSGLRGVGKTTCVRLAIHLIRAQRERFGRLCGELELVDVWINLARPLKPVQLLHHLIRHLYLRLKETQLLDRLTPQLREDLQTAFLRTSFEISSRSLAGEETSRSEQIGFGKLPWLGLEFFGKISSSYKRSRSEVEALKYLPYDEKAAEFEILSLSRRLLRGLEVKQSPWLRWWRALRKSSPVAPGIKVVFVLDELDKLESHTADNGKSLLDPVLQALKSVFTGSGFSFVFIGGREVEERLVEDISRGNSIYESIFAYDLYLPCLWEEQSDIVHDCMELRQGDTFDRQGTLALYLKYKGRGVPRRTWRELNKHVAWENDRPLLVLDQERRRHMEVFAKVQEALDADETFTSRNAMLDLVQSDRLRLGFYYTMDWVFTRGPEAFGMSHITSKVMELNLGVSSEANWPAKVADSVLKLLLARAFVERADRDLTQVVEGAEEALYRISPWVLLALRGASGKLWAPEEPAAAAPDRGRMEAERIGRYTLLDKIGEGGFALVYRVRDGHGKVLAAKLLKPELAKMPDVVELFERESQALKTLQHPGIVRVHDSGIEQGTRYVVMDLVEGVSLRQVIDSAKHLKASDACAIAARLAEIFDYVHGRGLRRLDIKPSNVILTDQGELKVVDFGIAVEEGVSFRPHVPAAGTPSYMAPEQLSEGQIDIPGDTFSLGVLLFEMLTGRLPLLHSHAFDSSKGPEEWLASINWTGVPKGLNRVLRKALARDPAARFQSMKEFASAVAPREHPGLRGLLAQLSRTVRRGAERMDTMTMPPSFGAVSIRPRSETRPGLAAGFDPFDQEVHKLHDDGVSNSHSMVMQLVADGARDSGRYQLLFDLSERACFLVLGNQVFRTLFAYDEALIMGRAPDVQLVLNDASISRRQLAFFGRRTGVEVEDLSSANGTLLNGKRIRRERLADQDIIQTGGCEIRVHVRPREDLSGRRVGIGQVDASSAP